MFAWLRSLGSRALAPARAAEPPDTRPPWVDEILEGLQKQNRAAAKQAARLEALIGECSADLRLAREELGRSASTVATTGEPYHDLFDALDALDQAMVLAGEPHLVEGLSRVRLRIQQFCERAGYTRTGAVGQPVDAASMRIVGTQRAGDVPVGSISRVVCAAIRRGGQLVREGQVIVQIEEKNDESQLGY
jgi:molecular chaperone GrpE (heat shock protein)